MVTGVTGAVPLPPCQGLVAGWRLRAGAPPEPLSAEAVPAAMAQGPVWLHLDLLDARARGFILALPGLPLVVRQTLIEPEEAVRLDLLEAALFGCFPDLHYDAEGEAVPPIGSLHLALTPTLLITARRHPLRGVHNAVQRGDCDTPADALATVLHATAVEFGHVITRLSARTAQIEDALLRPAPEPQGEKLAALQRDVLRLARALDALCEQLDELDDAPPAWLGAAGPRLLRERRRMHHAARALAGIRDRSRIAQDQAGAQATEETNRRLLVLSVISAAMLPASLVAGIFGMNVGGVPGVPTELLSRDWGFALALALIIASVGGVLAALRRLRLL